MKHYYRIMLGQGSRFADLGFAEGCVGVDMEIPQDLTGHLPEEWREFNRKFIPVFLASHPEKTKIGAGLACGALWVLAKGIQVGDMVLSPDGTGTYHVGEVTGAYQYAPGTPLPHRRPVRWLSEGIDRAEMSDALKHSAGSIGTVSNISAYRDELEKLIGGSVAPTVVSTDPEVEDPSTFALEKHLEDFLVANWSRTDFGKTHDIFAEDGEKVGQQYPTDTGPIDILAISKDKKELLVVELKRGRASDVVVGQLLRYMGFAKQELAEKNQHVRGVIIALDDDQRLRRALAASPEICFYRYQVSFKLTKA